MQIQTLTCSVTNGSNLVIAAPGLDWSQVTIGSLFQVDDSPAQVPIVAISAPGISTSGNYEIQLAVPFQGDTNAAQEYSISKDFTPNLGLPLLAPGDVNTAEEFSRAMRILDQIAGGMMTFPSVVTLGTFARFYAVPNGVQIQCRVGTSGTWQTKQQWLFDGSQPLAPNQSPANYIPIGDYARLAATGNGMNLELRVSATASWYLAQSWDNTDNTP